MKTILVAILALTTIFAFGAADKAHAQDGAFNVASAEAMLAKGTTTVIAHDAAKLTPFKTSTTQFTFAKKAPGSMGVAVAYTNRTITAFGTDRNGISKNERTITIRVSFGL